MARQGWPDESERVFMVELTSKKWKSFQLFGSILAIVGCVFLAWLTFSPYRSTSYVPLLVAGGFIGVGTILLIFGRVMAWWHHG